MRHREADPSFPALTDREQVVEVPSPSRGSHCDEVKFISFQACDKSTDDGPSGVTGRSRVSS